MVVRLTVFLSSANLICRSTDISKCFIESLGVRDNESRLYIEYEKMVTVSATWSTRKWNFKRNSSRWENCDFFFFFFFFFFYEHDMKIAQLVKDSLTLSMLVLMFLADDILIFFSLKNIFFYFLCKCLKWRHFAWNLSNSIFWKI